MLTDYDRKILAVWGKDWFTPLSVLLPQIEHYKALGYVERREVRFGTQFRIITDKEQT